MRPAGLEPAAFGAGNRRSVPLSYGRNILGGRGQVTGDSERPGQAVPCNLSPVPSSAPGGIRTRALPGGSQADRENPLPNWGLHPARCLCNPVPVTRYA